MAVHAGDDFYHLDDVDVGAARCQGTACFVARRHGTEPWEEADEARVYCLGRCYQAPVTATDVDVRPAITVDAPEAVLLGRVVDGAVRDVDDHVRRGGLSALHRARSGDPDLLIEQVEAAGLRGRGGAAFPTGRKWRAVRQARWRNGGPAYVVCNADEGDPGAYVDRILLEDDPYTVLEGMAIAAHAVGAWAGIVYVRKEYPAAAAAVRRAIDQLTTAGVLANGRGDGFTVEVVDGRGSYVCGEETALLNALEGRRPEVRVRPPYPAEHGLFGAPTVVNNVETLAAIPWIVRHGGTAYAALGRGDSRGTKAVSLSSLFRRPGLYEVELGVPLRHVVEDLGGGLANGRLRGVLVGGPLAGLVPPELLDVPFTVEDLRTVGGDVGHGGMVAVDEHTTIPELIHHVFRFGAYESCGTCTPCRQGTAAIERRFAAAAPLSPGAAAPESDVRPGWAEVVDALAATSLCGHGTGLAAFARSILTHYAEEVRGW